MSGTKNNMPESNMMAIKPEGFVLILNEKDSFYLTRRNYVLDGCTPMMLAL